MDGRRTTIKDIAEYCGVSAGTVHNALNGKKGVSPAMREKIIAAAREHNFRINTVAASLKRKPLRIVVCLPGASAEGRFYYTYVWQGVRQYFAEMNDLNIDLIELPFYNGSPNSQSSELIDVLKRYNNEISGLITVGMNEDDENLRRSIERYNELNIPVVLTCDDISASARLAVVQPDYEVTGRIAAELLASQTTAGDTIMILAGDQLIPSHYLVTEGFEKYLAENNQSWKLAKVYGYNNSEDTARKIRELLRNRTDITAVFSVTSRISVLMSNILAESGMAGKIRFVGSDIFPENVESMKQGVMHNIMYKNPSRQAWLAAKTLTDFLLRGDKPLEDKILTESNVIFRSGLHMY